MPCSTAKELIQEMKERLQIFEDRVDELGGDLITLQKQLDNKVAQHEKVVAEYKARDQELQNEMNKLVIKGVTPRVSLTTCLAAEVSKVTQDLKWGSTTKLANRTISEASLISYEDKENKCDTDQSIESISPQEESNKRAVSRKRVTASSSCPDILRERQVSTLAPVAEDQAGSQGAESRGGGKNRDSSILPMVTPCIKKRKKLYTNTPQHSVEFTPPSPTSGLKVSPGSTAKKQLRDWSGKRKLSSKSGKLYRMPSIQDLV